MALSHRELLLKAAFGLEGNLAVLSGAEHLAGVAEDASAHALARKYGDQLEALVSELRRELDSMSPRPEART